MKNRKKNPIKLDEKEKELLKSIESGEWKSVSNLENSIIFAKKTAENTLLKDAQINIRISKNDLEKLKQKAAYRGLPYQTFISSVLHEYAAGHFDGK